MTNTTLITAAQDSFAKTFGVAPTVTTYAPGRVNLLGEHTDYNGGLVLPMPLGAGTAVALGTGGAPGMLEAASTSISGIETRPLNDAPKGMGHWTDYILGSLKVGFGDAMPDEGLRIMITTDLPVGSGLSSSAALEVAVIRAVADMTGTPIDPVTVAQLARKAENDFVGMPCGIMDQFSVSVGTPGTAIFLNTRTLAYKPTPLPESHNFVVVHSGIGHENSDGGYAQRVRECQAACAALNVEMLSDLGLDDLDRIADLPAPLDGRARHIVTENARVTGAVAALGEGDTATFARLMIESHASQRDDYAVSKPQIDDLVQGAMDAGADGARLTGGGFGGSIVALVKRREVEAWCDAIEAGFPDARILAVT